MGIEKPPEVRKVILAAENGEPGAEKRHRRMSSAGGTASGKLRKMDADIRAANDAADMAERIAALAETEKVVDGEVLPPDPPQPEPPPVKIKKSSPNDYLKASRGE